MKINEKFQIEFPQFGIKIPAMAGENLLELMQKSGILIDAPCGGVGRCGKCELLISGKTAARDGNSDHASTIHVCAGNAEISPVEALQIDRKTGPMATRRACLTQVTEDLIVMLPRTNDGHYAVLTEYAARADKSGENHADLRADIRKNPAYAVAIDLGTTTLVAKLIDLSTGIVCASAALHNAQSPYGADVISRIQVCMDDASVLSRLITEQIDTAIAEMLHMRQITAEAVTKLVLAGNTSMSYILLGLPCRSLGLAPFLPMFELKESYSYNEIFHTDTLSCPCLVTPFLSAYVGGDIAAGLFSLRGEDDFILMDMGTNGELAFRRGNRLICTATAAGPAFEGGNIECGMGSTRGAISSVRYENGAFAYETIGAAAPAGLCGSGILDLMAVLLREGIIDETGLMAESLNGRRTLSEDGAVYFSQKDVRQFQLAKSAVRCGLEILIGEMGDAPAKVFLAGGFGQNLDPESAVKTGLLPEYFRGRIHAIGNSSLGGAVQLCMLSASSHSSADACTHDRAQTEAAQTEAFQYLRALTASGTEINLATHPRFNDLFMEYMAFERA